MARLSEPEGYKHVTSDSCNADHNLPFYRLDFTWGISTQSAIIGTLISMTMSTPSSIQEFKDFFPSWSQDSLAFRTDPLGPGSSWDKREIGTFQILRRPPNSRFPLPLRPYLAEATALVESCEDIRSVIELLGQNWRDLTHHELVISAGAFASFFVLLAQIVETPVFLDPRRELRSQISKSFASPAEPAIPSSPPLPPSLPSLPSSPVQPPTKKMRQHRSSDSYIPSDQSDQSSHDHRTKSEVTTNACIYELLRCVTELLRVGKHPPVYLEWSIKHDTFIVEAGKLSFSTTNDGSLVRKASREGYWQRASKFSYCSIESWHDVHEKPPKVQAQEAAHLIGMYSQYASGGNALQHNIVLPLISLAQNIFSLVIGTFPAQYTTYLCDGNQSEDGVFVEVDEYGMFELQEPSDLTTVFTLIVALHLWL